MRLSFASGLHHPSDFILLIRLQSFRLLELRFPPFRVVRYRPIILPVVLYGCETWSVTTIEGRTEAEVFENGVLRRIFGPKRDEVTAKWRKVHNEELIGVSSRAIA